MGKATGGGIGPGALGTKGKGPSVPGGTKGRGNWDNTVTHS